VNKIVKCNDAESRRPRIALSRETQLRVQKCAHNPLQLEAILTCQGNLPNLKANTNKLKSNIFAANLLPSILSDLC
jgi:hypothetical protein